MVENVKYELRKKDNSIFKVQNAVEIVESKKYEDGVRCYHKKSILGRVKNVAAFLLRDLGSLTRYYLIMELYSTFSVF